MIEFYLNNAAYLARTVLRLPHAELFSPVEPLNLPRIGHVRGTLGFLVSTLKGNLSVRKYGMRSCPDVPQFLCIVVKKESTLAAESYYSYFSGFVE